MHGKTMAEDDYTDHLLVKYGCPTLEETFLAICNGRKPSSVSREDAVWIRRSSNEKCSDKLLALETDGGDKAAAVNTGTLQWLRNLRVRGCVLKAIIMKNFINLYRFPGALLFLLILPCSQIMAVLFGISNPINGLTLAVVNEDVGNFSRTFLAQLDPWLFRQAFYGTFQDGMIASQNGEAYGVITIGQNFSQAIHSRLLGGVLQQGEVFNHSTISVSLDNTFYHINMVAQYQLLKNFQHFVETVVQNSTATSIPSFASPIIQFDSKTMEYFKTPSVIMLLIGTMVSASYFAPVGFVIFSLYVERMSGHLERTCITGATSAEIILGLVVILVLMLLPQIGLLIFPVCWSLESIGSGSTVLVTLLLFFQGISGMSLGLFLAMAFDNSYILVLMTGLSMTVVPCLGGYIWPLQALPFLARPLFLASPFAYTNRAINALLTRNWDLSHADVQWGCGVSVIWTMVFIMATLVLFRVRV